MYVTGIQKLKDRAEVNYTEAEEEQFKLMSKDPELMTKIYKSIAPGIYGNDEIKQAIACMLFGGSQKRLPDNTILRGDVNILLIGDPSTAKSQFLKFVEQTAAIAVYTSGKGSSAAGLTASITKDSTTG
jgi:DNA replication licensing factor MCM5